jgi:hypothetical protein
MLETEDRTKDQTEEKVKSSMMKSFSKDGRRLKFIPSGKKGPKSILLITGLILALIIGAAALILSSGRSAPNIKPTASSDDGKSNTVVPENNNSSGYISSGSADFKGASLNLNYQIPDLAKSEDLKANIGQQLTLQTGFAIKVVSLERDWRPASEYVYKEVSQAGDEIVRVNVVVGNASIKNMDLSYGGLALYVESYEGKRFDPEPATEDSYSPKNGQSLSPQQFRNISLHYRVPRGAKLRLVKSVTLKQDRAKEKDGQERAPKLSLSIDLEK